MIRKLIVVAIATLMIGGALATGVTSASAADPLKLVPVNPGGVNEGARMTLPDAIRGHAYSFQLGATGGVPGYTFEARYPTDMSRYGLSVSPSGLISGTIVDDPSYVLITGFNIIVRDSVGTTLDAFLGFRIQPNFRITTATLPNGSAGGGYYAQLSATAGTAPFIFTKGSTLPIGMKVSKAGLLSGVPKWGGQYAVTINVKDSAGSSVHFASRSYTLTVTGAPKPGGGGAGAGGAVPNFAATGDISCGGGLTLEARGQGGSTPYVSARIKGTITCTGGTGNPRVTITKGTVAGSYGLGQVCSVLGDKKSGSNASFLPFEITWKAKGGSIWATRVAFDGHRASSDGFRFPVPGGTGTSQVTGSYAGVGTASAAIGTSPSQLETLCQGFPAKAKVTGVFLLTL